MTPDIRYEPESELIFISQELDELHEAACIYSIHDYTSEEALADFLLTFNDMKAEHESN